MSLAEELLADLEDDDDYEAEGPPDPEAPEDMAVDGSEDQTSSSSSRPLPAAAGYSLDSVAKLYRSERLRTVVDKMEEFSESRRRPEDLQGPVEADPEYLLIVEANNLAAEIDDEIGNVHKFAKEKYSKRFPELETLVVQPLDYLMTAKELGNDLTNVKNNRALEPFLNQATVMVVSVTASTTQGSDLDPADLATVEEACDVALALDGIKARIFDYVESRMALVAPNLSAVVGASTAAKLMGAAGGLTALSKMPSGHVQLLGQQKKASSSSSSSGYHPSAAAPQHAGFIHFSEAVQKVPPDLRRKAARVVGAKCALAARIDSFHQSPDGRTGHKLAEEVDRKLDKFLEPPPVKATKALPAPIDASRKRRGGRRVRKMKERYAVTELRKQANRMNFGELAEDVYQNDLGFSRGNIGKSSAGSGGIRMAQVDERTKVRVSQTLKRNLQKQQAWGGATTSASVRKHVVSGTASSVAFTPLQGLEIVNPQAAEKRVDEANAKYFSPAASFMKVAKTPLPPSY